MHKLFNNILIPVRFTTASEKLIEKGIELANLYRCNIHLLYIASISSISSSMITRSWSFFQKVRNEDSKELERMLNKLTDRYAAKLHHGLKIVSSIEKGGRNEIAVNYILQNNIDLVLDTAPSGRLESNRTNLDANRIAGKTNAAIITIPENRRINHLYSIVIPITDFIPLKKLMYGIYFARYYHTTIHLLGVVHEQDYMYTKKVQKYLQRSYQLIRDNCNVPIDMTIKDGLNVAEVVKEYTTKNNADLVIVNPGRQSRLRGRAFGLFAAFLQKKVNPPVLTIGQI